MAALVADDRYQKLLTYWRVGPRGLGHLKSKNFVVALRSALNHRVQSVLHFRQLGHGVDGRALSLYEVRAVNKNKDVEKGERREKKEGKRKKRKETKRTGDLSGPLLPATTSFSPLLAPLLTFLALPQLLLISSVCTRRRRCVEGERKPRDVKRRCDGETGNRALLFSLVALALGHNACVRSQAAWARSSSCG